MTNVNPGNRDPRKGRLGGSRKLFSRDKNDDLLQDRDDLVDDLGQDHAPEQYETAGDGSFGEALDEYYDTHADRDSVQPGETPRGRHHRREDEVRSGDDYDDYSEYHDDSYAATAASGTGYAEYADYADTEYEPEYEAEPADYRDHREVRDDREVRDYDDYDDDRAVAAPAAAAAVPAGAGAAAGGSSTAAAAGGVPKRGLAMVLIAVALLLALWGVYAMTKGGADDQAADDPANQSVQDQNDPNAQGSNGQNGQNGQAQNDPNAQGGNGQNGQNGQNNQNGQTPNDPNAQGQPSQPGQPGQPVQGDGAAPAGANNPMTRENMSVNVYNNSAISGFADQVAGQVKASGVAVGEVGNIPGEVVTFSENTVLFDKGTPGAEERARELADKVGGVAVPVDDRIPAEARKPGSLTLVLAENRPVNI